MGTFIELSIAKASHKWAQFREPEEWCTEPDSPSCPTCLSCFGHTSNTPPGCSHWTLPAHTLAVLTGHSSTPPGCSHWTLPAHPRAALSALWTHNSFTHQQLGWPDQNLELSGWGWKMDRKGAPMMLLLVDIREEEPCTFIRPSSSWSY